MKSHLEQLAEKIACRALGCPELTTDDENPCPDCPLDAGCIKDLLEAIGEFIAELIERCPLTSDELAKAARNPTYFQRVKFRVLQANCCRNSNSPWAARNYTILANATINHCAGCECSDLVAVIEELRDPNNWVI